MKTVDFSETIAASDLKGSRSRHLIEFMKVCELTLAEYDSDIKIKACTKNPSVICNQVLCV